MEEGIQAARKGCRPKRQPFPILIEGLSKRFYQLTPFPLGYPYHWISSLREVEGAVGLFLGSVSVSTPSW